MDKKQENQLHNVKGAYVHIKMALNHLACIDMKDLPDNYIRNKFIDFKNSAEKLIAPIERNLGENLGDVEDMLIEMHEATEAIL